MEPDECYWVPSEARVRGRMDLDPRVDPVVESEVSRSILDRLGILGILGVPEVWRYDGERVTVLVRGTDGAYAGSAASHCFPALSAEAITAQLNRARGIDETTWIRAFRAWVRATLG